MDLGLTERVAIVGGAGRETGRYIARTLVSEGAKVSICARNEEGLRRLELELAAIGSQQNVLAIPADLSEPRDIRRVVRDTFNRFGQINILIFQSGYPTREPASDLEDDDLIQQLEQTFLSALRLSREVIPHMKQEHWGRIINLAGTSPQQAAAGTALSTARQLYLIGYFKTLANELAPFNITVNNVLSGPLETQELRELLEERSRSEDASLTELTRATYRGVPMGRLGKPEELGDMIAFLASERAGYLTGACISIDGGQNQ